MDSTQLDQSPAGPLNIQIGKTPFARIDNLAAKTPTNNPTPKLNLAHIIETTKNQYLKTPIRKQQSSTRNATPMN